jgi:outer membrane protein OmpA-like peptidoglycan-associated protein
MPPIDIRRSPRRRLGRLAVAVLSAAALASPALAQPDLTSEQILSGLQAAAGASPAIDPAIIAQEALANVGKKPAAPLPAWAKLTGLPQLTVEINFELNSVAIVPDSYRALGLIADSLHHPILLGNKFLIVGHTDSTGNPKSNLELSQRRADAIKEVLSTTFAVPAKTLFTVGVGDEQPIDPANPAAAINRRVQIFNIGPLK